MAAQLEGDRPSKKQRELLNYIGAFIAEHGYGPSYREVMRALEYKSVSTVATHIEALIVKGYLRKRNKSARSLEVCNKVVKEKSTGTMAITEAQEKWLIDAVNERFKEVEEKAAMLPSIDHLYVLIGALHILGFADAARSYQSRLQAIRSFGDSGSETE